MQYDFLRQFQTRMKKVGAYAVLFKNSLAKTTWKTYGFEESFEQVNLLFSVLLYIMESSLKEEPCTMDDIANFIDQLNLSVYQKALSYEEAKELANFIVDVVFCNEGARCILKVIIMRKRGMNRFILVLLQMRSFTLRKVFGEHRIL